MLQVQPSPPSGPFVDREHQINSVNDEGDQLKKKGFVQ